MAVVTLFFILFFPLGMEISVLCLPHHYGVGADNLLHRLIKWKEFFFLLASGYFLQHLVYLLPQPCELRSKVRNMAWPFRARDRKPPKSTYNVANTLEKSVVVWNGGKRGPLERKSGCLKRRWNEGLKHSILREPLRAGKGLGSLAWSLLRAGAKCDQEKTSVAVNFQAQV